MPFPKRLLQDDEEVLLDSRPHWWRLVGPGLAAFVTVGGCATVFAVWSGSPIWFGWVLLGMGALGVGYFLVRFVQWRSTELVVTSMRVIYRSGVVSRAGREIPISSVQDVSFVQSLPERLIGKGRLAVRSAGVRGDQPFCDIRRPDFVQGLIDRTIEESRRRDSIRVSAAEHDSVSAELEHLAALHRRGVITDGEFEKLKALLIDTGEGDGDDRWEDAD